MLTDVPAIAIKVLPEANARFVNTSVVPVIQGVLMRKT